MIVFLIFKSWLDCSVKLPEFPDSSLVVKTYLFDANGKGVFYISKCETSCVPLTPLPTNSLLRKRSFREIEELDCSLRMSEESFWSLIRRCIAS